MGRKSRARPTARKARGKAAVRGAIRPPVLRPWLSQKCLHEAHGECSSSGCECECHCDAPENGSVNHETW
jgi:hypothetical protein